MRVYDDLNEFIIDNQYTVVAFGHDPYNAKDFVDKWCSEYGEYGVEKVRQGAITESVPLGSYVCWPRNDYYYSTKNS